MLRQRLFSLAPSRVVDVAKKTTRRARALRTRRRAVSARGVIAHSRPHFNPLPGLSPSLASAFFFFIRRLATPALRLGVLAASWLLTEAFVFQRCSPMYAVWVRLVLQLYAM